MPTEWRATNGQLMEENL